MADDQTLVDEMLNALANLPARLVPHILEVSEPQPGSPAAAERSSCGDNEAKLAIFDYAPQRARLALAVAADALQALARVLRLPPPKLAPGGVARDVLESTAYTRWLVGPVSSAEERLDRVARVKAKDLDEARKISDAGLKEEPGREEFEEAVMWASEQIALFDEQVTAAGSSASECSTRPTFRGRCSAPSTSTGSIQVCRTERPTR